MRRVMRGRLEVALLDSPLLGSEVSRGGISETPGLILAKRQAMFFENPGGLVR